LDTTIEMFKIMITYHTLSKQTYHARNYYSGFIWVEWNTYGKITRIIDIQNLKKFLNSYLYLVSLHMYTKITDWLYILRRYSFKYMRITSRRCFVFPCSITSQSKWFTRDSLQYYFLRLEFDCVVYRLKSIYYYLHHTRLHTRRM